MAKDEFACPGEVFVDKTGGPHEMEWHKGEGCQFCKGRGRRSFVGGMPEVDRYGTARVDFCCHPCKNNHKNQGSKINNGIRTSIS